MSTKIPRIEAANLAGITSLMNKQNIKPSVDLTLSEKKIMGTNNTYN